MTQNPNRTVCVSALIGAQTFSALALCTLVAGALATFAPTPQAHAQSSTPEPQSGMTAPPISEAAPPPALPPSIRGFDYWQPEWMMRELWGPGRMSKGMEVRMKRHDTFIQKGVPETYRAQHAMVPPTPSTLGEGKDIYERNCATCHGIDGMGDGDHANALSPSPALLAYMIRRPIAVDEYLLWSISEGGAAFGSQMPAFKDELMRDEIWKVVTYMRAGFPGAKSKRP